jgi:hypothetical protein
VLIFVYKPGGGGIPEKSVDIQPTSGTSVPFKELPVVELELPAEGPGTSKVLLEFQHFFWNFHLARGNPTLTRNFHRWQNVKRQALVRRAMGRGWTLSALLAHVPTLDGYPHTISMLLAKYQAGPR